jgi:hypothetical protein
MYGCFSFTVLVNIFSNDILWLLCCSSCYSVGPYFITDMQRDQSIFERDPSLVQLVNEGIEKDGSNLGHVTALCAWSPLYES